MKPGNTPSHLLLLAALGAAFLTQGCGRLLGFPNNPGNDPYTEVLEILEGDVVRITDDWDEPTVEATPVEHYVEVSSESGASMSEEGEPDPAASPSPESELEPELEPSMDPSPEPSADPSVEPSPEPSVEPSVNPSVDPSPDPSPSPEPAPEASEDPSPSPSPET